MIRTSCLLAKALMSCLATFAVLAFSTFALAQTPADNPDLKETATYPLTMDKVRRLAAAAKDLAEYQKSNPDLSLGPKKSDSNKTSLTEMAKEIDSKFPQATAIIKKNGYSTREFLVATTTFALTSMAVGFKKSGMAVPPGKSEGPIVEANKELLEKNWDEVQKLSAAMRPSNNRH